MIVYGTRAKLIRSEYVAGQCPNCGTNNSIYMSVFQRYAHIFWIPFFPVGKTGVSVCAHCKQTLNSKIMPADPRFSYDNLAMQSQTPIWSYSGLGIVALIVMGVTANQKHTSKKINEYVMAPKAGDVLHVKLKDTVFTLFKISRVEKDSVYILMANYQSDQEEDLDEIAGKGYDTVENAVSKEGLINMNKDEKILDIERN